MEIPVTEISARTRPKVLLAKASDGPPALLGGLEGLGIDLLHASNFRDAKRMMATCPNVLVVLTDHTLPDGNWRAVAKAVAENCVNAELVVLGGSARRSLASGALRRRAYSLLVEPYSPGEVLRIVGGAALSSYRRCTGIADMTFTGAASDGWARSSKQLRPERKQASSGDSLSREKRHAADDSL